VLCSQETGSRTIVHSNGTLPQLTINDFETKINLANYAWIHFEVKECIINQGEGVYPILISFEINDKILLNREEMKRKL